MKRAAALLLSLLIAGCASSGTSANRPDDTDAARINLRLGVGYMEQGHLDTAKQKLQLALKYNPKLAEADNALGVLYEQSGDPEQAERYYRKAIQLKPRYLLAKMNLARVLCAHGKTDEGKRMFLAAVKDPRLTAPEIAYTGAGVCARRSGHLKEAERLYRLALQKNPDAGGTLFEMARLLHLEGDNRRAKQFLLRYHKRASFNPVSLELAMTIEHALGDTRMRDYYAHLLKRRFPHSPQAKRLAKAQ